MDKKWMHFKQTRSKWNVKKNITKNKICILQLHFCCFVFSRYNVTKREFTSQFQYNA